MLSDHDKALIHAAMEKAGGKVSEAAVLLGMDNKALHAKINNNKDLKLRWSKGAKTPDGQPANTPPSEAITLHRPTLPDKPAVDEKEIAAAVEREDALVRKGLSAIGVKGRSLDVAMALQKFHSQHFKRAIEMIGGGMTKQFLDLMAEVEAITAELNDKTKSLDFRREMILREDRSRLLDQMNKMYDRANQAVLTQAKVRAMEGGGKGDRGPRKPGFGPVVIRAEGNVTVAEK